MLLLGLAIKYAGIAGKDVAVGIAAETFPDPLDRPTEFTH